MTELHLSGGDLGCGTMRVRCNLAQASAPVEVNYDNGRGWKTTQYQCADTSHTIDGLREIAARLAAREVEIDADDFDCDCEEE